MATLMPSRLAAITQEHLDSESVNNALRPWRRRLSLQQILRWTSWGIIIGLLAACIVLLIARITPWENANAWAIGLALVSTVSALGLALWKRPSLSHTARVADRNLSLHDRLSTAWELRDQSVPLVKLQRHDALKQLQKHTPAKALSLRPQRSTTLFFLLMAICFVLLLVLPNPMTSVLKQQATFQARIAKQIASIEQVRQNLLSNLAFLPQSNNKFHRSCKIWKINYSKQKLVHRPSKLLPRRRLSSISNAIPRQLIKHRLTLQPVRLCRVATTPI